MERIWSEAGTVPIETSGFAPENWKENILELQSAPSASEYGPEPLSPILIDRFGRKFDYLRIAVNERCNLRCIYCMPESGIDFSPNQDLLTAPEIIRFIQITADLGVTRIRFTGGEPLLHPQIVRMVEQASKTPGIEAVQMTTNGVLLKNRIRDLIQAGLNGVNISLDTLNEKKYLRITRRPVLESVMDGLEKSLGLGIPSVKINAVALRGFNDNELGDFVELTRSLPITVRFIELMPFDAHQVWKTGRFYRAEQIIEDLQTLYSDLDVEKGSRTEEQVFQVPGYAGKIAVISSYSRHICGECNRVRLTADGRLRNCLYAHTEINLLGLIRSGASDSDIATCFKQGMWDKLKDGWEAQKQGIERRESMTQIGG